MLCLPLNCLTFRQGLRELACLELPVPPPQSLPSPLPKYVWLGGRAGGPAYSNIITTRIDKSPNAFIGTEFWVRKLCFKIEYSGLGNRGTDDENVGWSFGEKKLSNS